MIELLEIKFFNILIYRERATSCTRGWFLCLSDGRCLENNLVCDGVQDCLDASDENKGMFC
jgi:hypothetical protein